jgi:hypothetical protein
MVEVAVGGGYATAGEDAGGVACFDLSSLGSGGSAAGGAVVEGLAGVGVGDGPPPGGVVLLLGDLAGDVGDDRTEPGQFPRMLGEFGEGGEVDVEVDAASAAAAGLLVAVEEVDEDVGAELVDGAVFSTVAEAFG